MARHKDKEWNMAPAATEATATVCVLMDIRDELKRLNELLYCQNFVGIPRKLESIRRAVAKTAREQK